MPRIQTNFQGLVRLLAKNLYPEPDVFIRELIQNGHDAIQFRRLEDRHLSGRIDILTDALERTIQFLDNGMGMNAQEVETFLSTIGTSGTGEKTQEFLARGDKAQALTTIGPANTSRAKTEYLNIIEDEAIKERLNSLSNQYYELKEESVLELLKLYAIRHPQDFQT